MSHLTPAQMLTAAQTLVQRCPDAVLMKNDVGNLSIVEVGAYTGWVDLRTGEITVFADEVDEPGE